MHVPRAIREGIQSDSICSEVAFEVLLSQRIWHTHAIEDALSTTMYQMVINMDLD